MASIQQQILAAEAHLEQLRAQSAEQTGDFDDLDDEVCAPPAQSMTVQKEELLGGALTCPPNFSLELNLPIQSRENFCRNRFFFLDGGCRECEASVQFFCIKLDC